VYPKTEAYFTDQVIQDLVAFAAAHLKVGGRLVYWQPTLLNEDVKKNLQHIEDPVLNSFADFSALESPSGASIKVWPSLDNQKVHLPLAYIPTRVDIPFHPAMKLIAASEQRLNSWSRWLMTLEKVVLPSHLSSDSLQTSFKANFRHFGDDLFKRSR
jgi:hypothetical protein